MAKTAPTGWAQPIYMVREITEEDCRLHPLIHTLPPRNSLQNVGGGIQRASNLMMTITDGATALLRQVIRIKTTGKPDSTLGADMCALLETA
jgi:hypothetical protein